MDAHDLSRSRPCGGAPEPVEQQAEQTEPAQDAAPPAAADDRHDDVLTRNDSALAELIAARRPAMLRRAEYLLGPEGATVGRSGTSADDAVQEASAKLLERHRDPDGLPADSMKPGYDTKAAYHAAIDLRCAWKRELRGKTVEGSDAADDAQAQDRYSQDEAARDDADVLAVVPKHFRCLGPGEQLVLRGWFEGRTQREIARQAGMSEGWVSGEGKALGRRLYQCIELGECPRREGH